MKRRPLGEGLTGLGERVGVGVSGAGVLEMADGSVYDGEWKIGQYNGRGERIMVPFILSDVARRSTASECGKETWNWRVRRWRRGR